jgi:hypothetical protein
MYLEPNSWPPVLSAPSGATAWRTIIDGVDIWAANVTPFHKMIYDTVQVADIRKHVKVMPQYDVVLLADVIEHFEKAEGLHLLRGLLGKATKAVIVTTPVGFAPQGVVRGNEAERHRSGWWPGDFSDFARVVVDLEEHKMLIVLCKTEQAERTLRRLRLRRRMYRLVYGGLGVRVGGRAAALARAVRGRLRRRGADASGKRHGVVPEREDSGARKGEGEES